MNDRTTKELDAATSALLVRASARFRDAAHASGLPLPAINAFAAWKTAADLLFQAHAAGAREGDPEGLRLTGWSVAKLTEMDAELAKLAPAEDRA